MEIFYANKQRRSTVRHIHGTQTDDTHTAPPNWETRTEVDAALANFGGVAGGEDGNVRLQAAGGNRLGILGLIKGTPKQNVLTDTPLEGKKKGGGQRATEHL